MTTDRGHLHRAAEELAALVEASRGAAPARLWRVEAAGRAFRVKTEERPSLRMRLQKGSPRRAFEAERAATEALAAAGLPVPPIPADGKDLFVTPHCGGPLRHHPFDRPVSEAERLAAFRAGAEGLARFHARGLSHGRPSLKDIRWDDRKAWFLGLERFAARRNRLEGHAKDLVMPFLAAFSATGRPTPDTEALAAGYRAHDPGGVCEEAARFCRRMRRVDPRTRPMQRRRGGREFRAIAPTFVTFAPGGAAFRQPRRSCDAGWCENRSARAKQLP